VRWGNFPAWPAGTVFLLACGCGSDGAAPDAGDASPGDVPVEDLGAEDAPVDDLGAGDADECPAAGEPIDLTGTWAARAWIHAYMVTGDEAIVHLCPERFFGVTVITLRVLVDEQTGTTVRHRFNVCRLQVPLVEAAIDPGCESTVAMQLAVGRPLTALWPGIDYDGGATLGSTRACASYTADPLVVVFGTDGTIGGTDPLPAWREDCELDPARCVDGWEHVIDGDGDGHPGVTLTVESDPEDLIRGEAYTAFRTVDQLVGTALDSDVVVGVVEPTMEYRIVGSDVLLGGGPLPPWAVQENVPYFEIPAEGSTFVLLRADGRDGALDLDADDSGEVTCAEILAAESVFAAYQP
jgi:hypothetical protein